MNDGYVQNDIKHMSKFCSLITALHIHYIQFVNIYLLIFHNVRTRSDCAILRAICIDRYNS